MMTTLDVLRLVRRWWWVLVIGPLVAAGVAYLISSTATPMYRASATVVIEVAPSSSSSGYNNILEAEKRTRTYSTLVETRPVLTEAANRIGITNSPNELRDKITVSPVRDTQLLRIAVMDASPARAAAVANTVAQVFIEQQSTREQATAGSAGEALAAQINEVERDISGLTTQIAEYNARPDVETPAIQDTIEGLENQLSQYQSILGTLIDMRVEQQIAVNERQTRLWVAEDAIPPRHPATPRVVLNTGLGGVIGLVLSGALVMFIGYIDNTVKTSEDVRRLTGSAAVGTIPITRAKEGLEPLQFPRSPATEAYRALRTNLQFSSLGRDVRSLVVTSPRPGDGKTTTMSNLATVLAQGGQRVILVDADLRKPRLHKVFTGLANRTGLTNLLLADARVDLEPLLQLTPVQNLRVLTTGPLPPNPSDVLNSPRMREVISQITEVADVVLIDAPPMAVSDALIIASLVDGVLLVTTGGRTRANELTNVVEALSRSGTNLTGVVVNRARLQSESYYYYQSYYTEDSGPAQGPPNDDGGSDGDSRDRRRVPTPFGRRSTGAEHRGTSGGK